MVASAAFGSSGVFWSPKLQGAISGRVPGAISRGLESVAGAILDGASIQEMDLWPVHPGGRSALDAVEHLRRSARAGE